MICYVVLLCYVMFYSFISCYSAEDVRKSGWPNVWPIECVKRWSAAGRRRERFFRTAEDSRRPLYVFTLPSSFVLQ